MHKHIKVKPKHLIVVSTYEKKIISKLGNILYGIY